MQRKHDRCVVVLVGPTASGKTTLAIELAEAFFGEVISCDAVALYRELDIGSAKPSLQQRKRITHHGLDLLDPNEPSTAGDFAHRARAAIAEIDARGRLPLLSGGTGLYLRAVLEGLAPAPKRDDALRERLRRHVARRGSASLHRILQRLDLDAARLIHPHDIPKLIRSVEVTLLGGRPQTEQWQTGSEPLSGFRILKIGLDPPRVALYERINSRAAAMFSAGLVEEATRVAARYGEEASALRSLGYAQALNLARGQQSAEQAIAEAQQGHRNYAKRQLTWFRRDKQIVWLQGFGDDEAVQKEAQWLVEQHLIAESSRG